MRRVVITGMGAITPVGLSVEEFWNSVKEGKTNLVIGIGCTGGKHRSVAIAQALTARLEGNGEKVYVSHRDQKFW